MEAIDWTQYEAVATYIQDNNLRLVWRRTRTYDHHDVVWVGTQDGVDRVFEQVYNGIDRAGSRLAFIGIIACAGFSPGCGTVGSVVV